MILLKLVLYSEDLNTAHQYMIYKIIILTKLVRQTGLKYFCSLIFKNKMSLFLHYLNMSFQFLNNKIFKYPKNLFHSEKMPLYSCYKYKH